MTKVKKKSKNFKNKIYEHDRQVVGIDRRSFQDTKTAC